MPRQVWESIHTECMIGKNYLNYHMTMGMTHHPLFDYVETKFWNIICMNYWR